MSSNAAFWKLSVCYPMLERRRRSDSLPSFDCSTEEFVAMLEATNNRFTFPISHYQHQAEDENLNDLEWNELVNAELALLASIQRHARLAKLYASD
jgi:hypothetical protein